MKLEPLRLTPGTDLLLALAGLPLQRGERAGVVISGNGSLSIDGAHLHLSVADVDGRVTGGHLLEGSLC